MLTAPFIGGVGIYAFYAMQPYLLELYGDEGAYGIAGLAAAIVAGAQIAGGLSAPRLRLLFRRRTSLMLAVPSSASWHAAARRPGRVVLVRHRAAGALEPGVRG